MKARNAWDRTARRRYPWFGSRPRILKAAACGDRLLRMGHLNGLSDRGTLGRSTREIEDGENSRPASALATVRAFSPAARWCAIVCGYVFCRFDATGAAPIVTTPGVIRIVSCGAVPARINEHEIAAIRQALASGQTVVPLTLSCRARLSRITDGPLRGLSGTVLGVARRQFLVISITLLQRSIAVEVQHSWVRSERAGRTPRYAWDVAREAALYHLTRRADQRIRQLGEITAECPSSVPATSRNAGRWIA